MKTSRLKLVMAALAAGLAAAASMADEEDLRAAAFGPRETLLLPDKRADWEHAVSDSTDLTKMPENLEWLPGNRGFPRGKHQQSAMINCRHQSPMLNKDGSFKQKERLTEWNRRYVELTKEQIEDKSAHFFIKTARMKFGLWVNGQFVGQSYQALLPKQFEVTKFLKPGKNEFVFAITTYEGMWNPEKKEWYAPHYSYGDQHRFEGPIRLEFRPKTYIDDVFVRTRVEAKEVEFWVTVKNAGKKAKQLRLGVQVTPERDRLRPHLEYMHEAVEVAAGEEKEIRFTRPWTAPMLLWDPGAAVFGYYANVRLVDGDDCVDEYVQNFAFREIRAEGRDILVNGKRMFFARDSIMGCSADFETWGYGRWKKGRGDVNSTRYHLGSLCYWRNDSVDKTGTVLVPEFGMMFFHPDHTAFNEEGVKEFCKGTARLWRNVPSALIYSLCNETVWHDTDKKWDRICNLYLSEMKKHSPDVLYQADADNTWNGKLDINNIHYPEGEAGTLRRKYPSGGFMFPNDLKWMTREEGSKTGGWRTNPFNWDKPLIIGEFYCFVPSNISGDQLYDWRRWQDEDVWGSHPNAYYDPQMESIAEEHLRMMCDWYRYCGVAGLNPWVREMSYAVNLTRLAPLEYQPNHEGGEKFKRLWAFFNDGGCPVGRFVWTMETEDRTWYTNSVMQLPRGVGIWQGSHTNGYIEAVLPERAEPYTVKLTAKAFMGNAEQARFVQKIRVMPKKIDLSAIAGKVGVFGDWNYAARLGLEKAVKLKDSIPANVEVAIVPKGAYRMGMAKMFNDFTKRGGTLMIMEQGEFAPYRGEIPETDLNHAATYSWIRTARHPAFRGLKDENMRCWGADNVVSVRSFRKPVEGDVRTLLECGGRDGLAWASLIEVNVGNGLVYLNTFPEDNVDPAVTRIFANLINYGVSRQPRQRAAAAVAAGSSQTMKDVLGMTFMKTTDKIAGAKVVIADKTAQLTDDQLKSLFAAGGTLWLHGMDEATLKKYAKWIPSGVTLVKRDPKQLGGIFVGQPSALLSGLATFDLAWYRPPHNYEAFGRAGSYWNNCEKTAEMPDEVLAVAEGTQGARLLVEPGFLAEVKAGEGRIFIDLMPWDTSLDAERDKTLRYLSRVAANLSVAFEEVERKQYSYRTVNLARWANMGYWDRVAGDGKGGWTDQGRNDMRTFLINHTGKNNYEDEGMETPVPPMPKEKVFGGVPFALVDPKRNHGKAVLSFGSVMAPKLMTEVKDIGVGAFGETFHVLHASAWANQKRGTEVAVYTLHYEDGTKAEVPVRQHEEVTDWWTPLLGKGCTIAWQGANKQGPVYLFKGEFKNPFPAKRVMKLDVSAAKCHAQYVVVAITFAKEMPKVVDLKPVEVLRADFTQKKFFPTLPQAWYGSDDYECGPEGMRLKESGGLYFGGFSEKKYPEMYNFQKGPFEVEVEITVNKLPEPRPNSSRVWVIGGGGLEYHRGYLSVSGVRMPKPTVTGQRYNIRWRSDGMYVYVYENNALVARRPAASMWMVGSPLSHLGICTIDVTIHSAVFRKLVPVDEGK